MLSGYHPDSSTGATSNPAEIYEDLLTYCRRRDEHHLKVSDQRTRLLDLVMKWHRKEEISDFVLKDITYELEKGDLPSLFRPLIYVIPVTESIEERIQPVPREKRASSGMEYIIPDLQRSEFDIIAPGSSERFW